MFERRHRMTLRDPVKISTPGGYLCALMERAGEGSMHLHKSLLVLLG